MVKYFEYYNADGEYVRIFIKNTVDTDEGMRFDIDKERTNKNRFSIHRLRFEFI